MSSLLISPSELFTLLDDPNLIILDASLPKPKAKAEDNPLASIQILNARFFDIEHKFSDQKSDLPHMMVSAEVFEREARELGISNASRIVVYDNLGVYSAPRAWWMFKSMGHEDVQVLNGGLPEWVQSGYPTETKTEQRITPGDFIANPQLGFFRSQEEVLANLDSRKELILDARSSGRFTGTEPEPREGLRGGHIPDSKSLPFIEVIHGNVLKDEAELNDIFDELNPSKQPTIFSCGSGLTACIILLAAEVVGRKNLSVYDGSWSEWGLPGDCPVKTGLN
ncbi:MAG: sulfurtransferase [Cyclobacteriaceae bacterium]